MGKNWRQKRERDFSIWAVTREEHAKGGASARARSLAALARLSSRLVQITFGGSTCEIQLVRMASSKTDFLSTISP